MPPASAQVLHLAKVPATGQPLQAKALRCHQLRPAAGDGGQVLHLVKIPAIGQPLQAKASRIEVRTLPAAQPATGQAISRLDKSTAQAVKQSAGWTSQQLRPAHRSAVSGQPLQAKTSRAGQHQGGPIEVVFAP